MADHDTEHAAERLISTVLRVGVVTSLVLVAAGMAITIARDPGALSAPLRAGTARESSLHAIAVGVAGLDGPAIVMVGLLLLIATPVLRVAVSIAIFVRERDAAFVAITAVVFALLVLSFVLGSVGG
jgi:uncharacterized membrane protein